MPKSVEIEDFATKLDVVCKRLNWSRGRLAQQAAIDKSLAWRWFGGVSRPGSNTLMRLNQAVVDGLPQFTAASWDLPLDHFRDRFSPEPSVPRPPANAALGKRTIADRFGGFRSVQRFTADLDDLAPIFSGFYRLWSCAADNSGRILRQPARIWREENALLIEFVGCTGALYRGFCQVIGRQLHVVVEAPAFGGPGTMIVGGAYSAHPKVLTGIALYQSPASAESAITAWPVIMEYGASFEEDPDEDEQRWKAMASDGLTIEPGAEDHPELPPAFCRVLRPVVGAPRAEGSFDHILAVRPLA